jgi:type VI secretion system secreted protein Hcp
MAYDLFLKLDGIPGESLDDKHKDEIELQSFSWGESNPGAHLTASGGGAGAGRVSMQDFHFTAQVSKASPLLMANCASGKHIATGQLTVRQASGENRSGTEFLFYKFTTVVVSSISQAGDLNERPLDSVSLAFAKVAVEYKPQKSDGSLGAVVNFAWDLKANRKL